MCLRTFLLLLKGTEEEKDILDAAAKEAKGMAWWWAEGCKFKGIREDPHEVKRKIRHLLC
jgi:hypothetical protein